MDVQNGEVSSLRVNRLDYSEFDESVIGDFKSEDTFTTFCETQFSSSLASIEKRKSRRKKIKTNRKHSDAGSCCSSYSKEELVAMVLNGESTNFSEKDQDLQGSEIDAYLQTRRSVAARRSPRRGENNAERNQTDSVADDKEEEESLFKIYVNDDEVEDSDDDSDNESAISAISELTGVLTKHKKKVRISEVTITSDFPPVESLGEETLLSPAPAPYIVVRKEVEEPSARKYIRFSTVSVRYYERVLADNPSTIKGPPIGIGWNFEKTKTESVDTWEIKRGPPRPAHRLVMGQEERESLLEDLGYSWREIAKAVRTNVKVQNQRRQTIHNLRVAKFEEAVENTGKRMKNLFSPFRGGKNK
jgi:hypothetical protein